MFASRFPREGRDNNFQLIRMAAALAVVTTHSFSIVSGRFDSEPLAASLGHSLGNYAVDVFFVLSGVLVTQSLFRDDSLVRFAISRFLRIVPGLVLVVLGSAFLLGPIVSTLSPADYFGDPALPRYLVGALTTLSTDLALPGVFRSLPEAERVNVPIWTLKYEIAAYVSLGALVFATAALGFRAIVFAACGAVAFYILCRLVLPWPSSGGATSNALHFFLSFYLGAAAYALRDHVRLSLAGVAVLAALAIAAFPTPARELFEALAIAYTILWLAFLPRFAAGLVDRMGDYSFGLYIFAYPVQQTIRLVAPEIDPIPLLGWALLVTVPLSVMSWHFVEHPFLRRRDAVVAAVSGLRRTAGTSGSSA